MKCEVIKDLLPLYIENICSSESKKEIEAHLELCRECQQENKELREEYLSHMDNENIDNFPDEKTIFEKSKQEIKKSFANKIIVNIFKVIFTLGLFINMTMILVTFVIYEYKYPSFYFKELGLTQIWVLILPFLPTILAIIGIAVIYKFKKHNILPKIILVGIIPAIFFGGFCSLVFMIIPPISSTTNNLSNYMKMDGDKKQFENGIINFFPDQIPVSAKQAEYFYQRYTTFFSENIKVETSWILTPSEYDAVKQQVLNQSQFKNSHLSESGGNGIILSTISPENITIAFEYNDNIKMVIYRAYSNKSY